MPVGKDHYTKYCRIIFPIFSAINQNFNGAILFNNSFFVFLRGDVQLIVHYKLGEKKACQKLLTNNKPVYK